MFIHVIRGLNFLFRRTRKIRVSAFSNIFRFVQLKKCFVSAKINLDELDLLGNNYIFRVGVGFRRDCCFSLPAIYSDGLVYAKNVSAI